MLKVAFGGCCHGELNKIYATVAREGGADLLLIAGDFQSIRNPGDLASLQVPKKYSQMGDFWEYYSGTRTAPYLTIVIGGNHEASNYLSELFYGGWLAPNIYYLGKAGSVIYKGLRISGISGIYKRHNFRKGHFEKPPYNDSTIRSVYHVRDYEVNKIACLVNKPDIMISHDWPNNIEKQGDMKVLKKIKPYFIKEIEENTLGSPPLEFLLHRIKPHYWLAAHLHVHHEVKVQHQAEASTIESKNKTDAVATQSSTLAEDGPSNTNSDEILLDFDSEAPCSVESANSAPATLASTIDGGKPCENPHIGGKDKEAISDIDSAKQADPIKENSNEKGVKRTLEINEIEVTHFIALDKCLPKRRHIKILDIPQRDLNIPESAAETLCYDVDWLAITKAFQPYLNLTQAYSPSLPEVRLMREAIKQAKSEITTKLGLPADAVAFPVPNNFAVEAPSYGEVPPPTSFYPNSQTDALCEMLGIPNHNNC